MEKLTKKLVWCGAGPYGVGWCGAMVVEIGIRAQTKKKQKQKRLRQKESQRDMLARICKTTDDNTRTLSITLTGNFLDQFLNRR